MNDTLDYTMTILEAQDITMKTERLNGTPTVITVGLATKDSAGPVPFTIEHHDKALDPVITGILEALPGYTLTLASGNSERWGAEASFQIHTTATDQEIRRVVQELLGACRQEAILVTWLAYSTLFYTEDE